MVDGDPTNLAFRGNTIRQALGQLARSDQNQPFTAVSVTNGQNNPDILFGNQRPNGMGFHFSVVVGADQQHLIPCIQAYVLHPTGGSNTATPR